MVENSDVPELTGWSWNNSICDDAYGVHIDDMQIVNDETGSEVDIDNVNLEEIETISDLNNLNNPNA